MCWGGVQDTLNLPLLSGLKMTLLSLDSVLPLERTAREVVLFNKAIGVINLLVNLGQIK